MKRAAALGTVDFKEARFFDRNWWRRLEWLLGEVEAVDCRQLVALKFLQHSSALNYQAGKQAFDTHWKQLEQLQNFWTNLVFPWSDTKIGGPSSSELTERWRRTMQRQFGDKLDERVADFSAELKAKAEVRNKRGSTSSWAGQ